MTEVTVKAKLNIVRPEGQTKESVTEVLAAELEKVWRVLFDGPFNVEAVEHVDSPDLVCIKINDIYQVTEVFKSEDEINEDNTVNASPVAWRFSEWEADDDDGEFREHTRGRSRYIVNIARKLLGVEVFNVLEREGFEEMCECPKCRRERGEEVDEALSNLSGVHVGSSCRPGAAMVVGI